MSAPKADALPRIKSVKVGKDWTLQVSWDDGSRDRVDLTGLVNRSRHFRAFLEDPAGFREVKVAHHGSALAWANGLDYGADTLKIMAEEQRAFSGEDLTRFANDNGLNAAELAQLLDVTERTIRKYRTLARLPNGIALALRVFRSNRTIFEAHYRPILRRPPGRPPSRAGTNTDQGANAFAEPRKTFHHLWKAK
jgi:DNA-binding transcriptional regulator YiaG